MKTPKQKLNRKIIIAALLCLLVLAAGTLAYYKLRPTNTTSDTINYGAPTQDETSTGDSIKNSSQTTGGSDQSPAPTPSEDGSLPSVGMEITAANQSEGTLYIRALIQTVTSSGSCTLTISGPGSYTTSSGVQALPSTSTCTGFNVPISSLSAGTWTISVSFTNGNVRASASREVAVQ